MKTNFLTYFPDGATVIPDQSDVLAALEKLQTERRGLEARLRADGKVFKPLEFSEDSAGDIFRQGDKLLAHVVHLRGLLAGARAATLKSTSLKFTPPPSAPSTPPTSPPATFEKMNLDELCRAVRTGGITGKAAGNILDVRFAPESPLTTQCQNAKKARK